MKLYASPGACSLGPHIALQELGIEHDLELLNIFKGETQSAEHVERNPLGMVPVLRLDNGKHLTECAVILSYLADQKPEMGLIPEAGSWERYRIQQLLSLIATEFHKSFLPFFYGHKMLTEESAREELKGFYQARLEARWAATSEFLGEDEWLHGNRFSVADIYLYVIANWWIYLKLSLDRWPNLVSWMERMKNRPSVQAAHLAERGAKR